MVASGEDREVIRKIEIFIYTLSAMKRKSKIKNKRKIAAQDVAKVSFSDINEGMS